MEERTINRDTPVPTNHKAAEVLQPRKSPFNLPSPPISPHFTPIVISPLSVVFAIWANQLNTSPFQSSAKRITVVTPIGNDSPGIFPRPASAFPWNRNVINCGFQQAHFRRRGRRKAASQRNTFAVDHHHPLRTFSAFGRPHTEAPFLAEAKLPSANVSSQSSRPFSSNSPINTRQTRSHTSCSSQSRRRRQQVLYEGYLSGKSFHRAPLRSTHRMPSNTLRLPMGLRPPLRDRSNFGKSGSIFCHCRSVSSVVFLAMWIPFHGQVKHKPLNSAILYL